MVFARAAIRPMAMATKAVKSSSIPAEADGKFRTLRGPDRVMWKPVAQAPPWLDGSLPGDNGFDPAGLSKPFEYVQIELDALDQNGFKNRAGGVVGRYIPDKTAVSEDSLQPYTETFDILRFRECELIHGRWCMLATLGAITGEANTGVSWIDAGKVELEQAQYLGNEIPFDLRTLIIIEVLAMGYLEVARSSELDLEKRLYPGGAFDPFGLSDGRPEERVFQLRSMEIYHGRLAMVSIFGYASAAFFTGNNSVLAPLRPN